MEINFAAVAKKNRSQLKRVRQAEKRRLANKAVRSRVKTFIKKFEQALASGDRALAEAAYREAARQLDKAVSKGVLHKNRAADKKSRLWQKLLRVA